MISVWEDEELYLDVLDAQPACPRCGSALYDYDRELRASICDACGLYNEDADVVY